MTIFAHLSLFLGVVVVDLGEAKFRLERHSLHWKLPLCHRNGHRLASSTVPQLPQLLSERSRLQPEQERFCSDAGRKNMSPFPQRRGGRLKRVEFIYERLSAAQQRKAGSISLPFQYLVIGNIWKGQQERAFLANISLHILNILNIWGITIQLCLSYDIGALPNPLSNTSPCYVTSSTQISIMCQSDHFILRKSLESDQKKNEKNHILSLQFLGLARLAKSALTVRLSSNGGEADVHLGPSAQDVSLT